MQEEKRYLATFVITEEMVANLRRHYGRNEKYLQDWYKRHIGERDRIVEMNARSESDVRHHCRLIFPYLVGVQIDVEEVVGQ